MKVDMEKAFMDVVSILIIVPGIIYMLIYEDVSWGLFGFGVILLTIGLYMRLKMWEVKK